MKNAVCAKIRRPGRLAAAMLLLTAMLMWIFAGGYAFSASAEAETAVTVSDVDGLLAALTPGASIVLESGVYDLAQASGYGRVGGAYYHWESVYDGYELVLTDLDGLTISGSQASVTAEPRYANVLRFENCSGITLTGLTLGHSPEQGSCSGGVLYMDSCGKIRVESCSLYGCGILGADLWNCTDVTFSMTDIYECSQGALSVYNSSEVLFEYGRIHDCAVWGGLITAGASRNVAVVNSEIYNNAGEYAALVTDSGTGVYLGGLDIHDNSFDTLLSAENRPITVEACRFDIVTPDALAGLPPVDADGNTLTERDLRDMSMRTVSWTPAVSEAPAAPVEDADGFIHVSDVDSFLAAVGGGRSIWLEPGEYLLSEASDYGSYAGGFCRWEETFDGMELVIEGVSGLTIAGPGADSVTILAEPRYANVLRFVDCADLTLSGFTAGHTPEPGSCSGGVLMFEQSERITVIDCSLYGCGIMGIWAMDVRDLLVSGTEIYRCSQGSVRLWDCRDVRLTDCSIHDNGVDEISVDGASASVFVDGVQLG